MYERKRYKNIAITIMASIVGIAVLSSISVAATIPQEEWNKTFGGTDYDVFESVQKITDGGYIMAGSTWYYNSNNIGVSDAVLVKTDANGNRIWNQTFGGSRYDAIYSVRQTADGGFILAGYTDSFGAGQEDFWLVKTDANGVMIWSKTFGGSEYERVYTVEQTADYGYILAGYTASFSISTDVWLVKTDANGNKTWSKILGKPGFYGWYSIKQTTDGGYILAGDTNSFGAGQNDAWLVKTAANGSEQWNKTFGGTSNDNIFAFQQTTDGGYVLAGYTSSFGARSYDAWLVKTAANGSEQWNKTFGGINYDYVRDVQQTIDGGYVLAGYTQSFGAGQEDAWLVKTDANGNQIWNQTFGGIEFDGALSVEQSTDGGYVFAGITSSFGSLQGDAWLVKVSSDGTMSNQPPNASFNYSLTNPKAGEQMLFNASSSNDSDGSVVLYEWDWDADGVYDESSSDPEAIFWFPSANTFVVNLRVTDNNGSTGLQSKQINVSSSVTGRTNIVLASWYSDWYYHPWNPFLRFDNDYKDYTKIDKWLREKHSANCYPLFQKADCWKIPSGSKQLDWIRDDPRFSRIKEADIIHVLSQDMDRANAPGLTYKHFILSAMREEDIVHYAFRAGMSSYIPGVKVMLGYLLPSLPEFGLNTVSAIVDAVLPYQPNLIGLSVLLNGVGTVLEVNDITQLSAHLDESAYVRAMGRYFYTVKASCQYPGTDRCLEDEFTEDVINMLKLPQMSEPDKNAYLVKTKEHWKDLWRKYGDQGAIQGIDTSELGAGLYDAVREEARRQAREEIISALEKDMYALNRVSAKIASPGELRVYDSAGNVTGLVNGEIREEIPYSVYSEEEKTVEVFGVLDSYSYEVKGTGTGVYGLKIDSLDNGSLGTFNASEIPMTFGQDHQYAVNWDALAAGEQGVVLQIDYEGDGVFDKTIQAGINLTGLPRVINGTVIDSISRTGIAGAKVSTNTSVSTTTNTAGFYSLNVSMGVYNLTAKFDPTHYVNNTITVSTIEVEAVVQDIELVEKPKGSIRGGVIRK